jgi:hypothetical protein
MFKDIVNGNVTEMFLDLIKEITAFSRERYLRMSRCT